MKSGLSLICLALLAVSSVHSLPKIDSGDLSAHAQKFMASVKEKVSNMPGDSSEEAAELVNKISSIIGDFDLEDITAEADAETGEIGPNFNKQQFLGMIKRVSSKSWQKRCKKISGDDNAYFKAHDAKEEFWKCFGAWPGMDEIVEKANQSSTTEDFKPLLKAVCTHRSGFFACTDKWISGVSGCHFPKEMEFVHKVDRINKNMLDLVCANDENDFALFEAEGDGLKCLQSSMNEIMTCANKAVFSGTERILEKWIENEHFNCGMEADDCKIFDEVKSCFVSSVENCTNPKVKNMVSSVFQIIRDETKC